jgi:hypothetical protein
MATLIIIVALIVLLSVPLDVKFTWDSRRKPSGQIRLEWLFGVVKKDIHRVKSGSKKEESRERPNLGKELDRIRDFIEIIKIKGLVNQTLCLAKDGFRRLKIKHFSGNIRFGLDDPAETGFIFGLINSMKPFLIHYTDEFNVQPVFDDNTVCEGYLQGTFRLHPIRMTVPAIKFIWSPAVIKLDKAIILLKWKKRKYVRRNRQQSAG